MLDKITNVLQLYRIPELQQFNHESEKGRIRAETEVRELSAKIQGLLDEKNLWEQEAHVRFYKRYIVSKLVL